MSQRHIHEPFVFAALAFALTAGFGYAAILIGALAFQYPLDGWWLATVQAHGHAQLFGWAGLFVIGVGLFFLPRLRGTVLARMELAPYCLGFLAAGITLRSLCQPLVSIARGSPNQESLYEALGRAGMSLSGIIELMGVLLFVAMIASSFRRARPSSATAPIKPVQPYLVLAFASLVIATILNALLVVSSALDGSTLLWVPLDNALTHLMIAGFIVPLAIALSVRNLPLFMRLAEPPRRSLAPLLVLYVGGLCLRVFGEIEHLFWSASIASALGSVLEGSALLVFVWEFDILLRRKAPWTAGRVAPPPGYVETRKPTRRNFPDYGEFGRFELLIISAYWWLVVASTVAVICGLGKLLGFPALFNPDVERHSLTIGFITLLIFGMAVRMLPGFSTKTRIASPRLVIASFWLGNLAGVFRVAPLLVPAFPGASIALGISGTVGWCAVACLAVNLWRTFEWGTSLRGLKKLNLN